MRLSHCIMYTSVNIVDMKCSSYYNSANLCLSVCLEFDFRENRSPGELQTRPMCCSEPDDVPFIFEFVRMWSNYKIKRLCGIRYAFTANGVVGHSADGGALYCLIGGRHRAGLNVGLSQNGMVDNRRTILTLPSVLSAVCIAQN